METLAEKRYRIAPRLLRQPPGEPSRIFAKRKCVPSLDLSAAFTTPGGQVTLPERYIEEKVPRLGIIVSDNRAYPGHSSRMIAAVVRDYELDPGKHEAFIALLASELAEDILSLDIEQMFEEAAFDLLLDREGSFGLGEVDKLGGTVYLDGNHIHTDLSECGLSQKAVSAIEAETWSRCITEIVKWTPEVSEHQWKRYRQCDEAWPTSRDFPGMASQLTFGIWHPSIFGDEFGRQRYKISETSRSSTDTKVRSYDEHCVDTARDITRIWRECMLARGLVFNYQALRLAGSIEDVGRFCGVDSMMSAYASGIDLSDLLPAGQRR